MRLRPSLCIGSPPAHAFRHDRSAPTKVSINPLKVAEQVRPEEPGAPETASTGALCGPRGAERGTVEDVGLARRHLVEAAVEHRLDQDHGARDDRGRPIWMQAG